MVVRRKNEKVSKMVLCSLWTRVAGSNRRTTPQPDYCVIVLLYNGVEDGVGDYSAIVVMLMILVILVILMLCFNIMVWRMVMVLLKLMLMM